MRRDDGEASVPARAALHELAEVIDVAAHLVGTLASDSVLQRVLEAFRQMPLEDRSVVAEAIEREVKARRLSLATQATTGQSMHPNPHARLYLRSHERAVPRNMLERDELMLAMLSAMRVAPLLLVPDIHVSWVDGTREALGHLDAPTRTAIGGLLRDALALVDEAIAVTDPKPPAVRAS